MGDKKKNCPFYGRHIVFDLKNGRQLKYGSMFAEADLTLLDQHGNQCALVTDAYSPCTLEIERRPVDWRECPRVAAVQFPPPGKRPVRP